MQTVWAQPSGAASTANSVICKSHKLQVHIEGGARTGNQFLHRHIACSKISALPQALIAALHLPKMVTGLETAASALSIVSLAAQLFNGCVEGYKLCHSAQNIGKDGGRLHTKLQVQWSRLVAWARKAGLPNGPFKRLQWDSIILILGQQQELLRSAKALHERYRLSIGDEQPLLDNITEHPFPVEPEGSRYETPDLVERLKPLFLSTHSMRQDAANSIREHNGILRRMTWAIKDKEKLENIISEITSLNSQLVEFLNDSDKEVFSHEISTLYRALVSECKATGELDVVRQSMPPDAPSAILAAAHIKKLRLALKFARSSSGLSIMTDGSSTHVEGCKHFRAQKLMANLEEESYGTRITTYNQSVVMVEWRTITANWEAVRESLRDLAMLLQQANDSSFHSLPCAGYVDIQESGRFGFVYDVTELASGADATSIWSRSLFDLMPDCRFVSMVDRVRIACDIAEAVLQLHTAGWLHKGICSENVVFVAAARSSQREILTGRPYLFGYGYARPDTVSAAVMTEMPVTATNRDLYRHPNARGEARHSFQTRFDMYGLACVLTELALWRHLEEILVNYRASTLQQGLPSLNELSRDIGFQEELSFHVGPKFVEAIALCLDHKQDGVVEMRVLDALRSCRES